MKAIFENGELKLTKNDFTHTRYEYNLDLNSTSNMNRENQLYRKSFALLVRKQAIINHNNCKENHFQEGEIVEIDAYEAYKSLAFCQSIDVAHTIKHETPMIGLMPDIDIIGQIKNRYKELFYINMKNCFDIPEHFKKTKPIPMGFYRLHLSPVQKVED